MPPRIRMVIDTTEELRRAVQIRAAATGKTPSDLINTHIRDEYRQEIGQARRALKAEADAEESDD